VAVFAVDGSVILNENQDSTKVLPS